MTSTKTKQYISKSYMQIKRAKTVAEYLSSACRTATFSTKIFQNRQASWCNSQFEESLRRISTFIVQSCPLDKGHTWRFVITVNREMLVMVLFWPILAPKCEVPKLNTQKYVTLQKFTAKIELCLNIFLYLYSLICTFLSYFFP